MELRIDNRPVDLGGERVAIPGFDGSKLTNPNAQRSGRDVEIKLPANSQNSEIFGFAIDPHTDIKFNSELHYGQISVDGVVLLMGVVRLLSYSKKGYLIEIREGGAQWAESAALSMFNTLPVDYGVLLTPVEVYRSWTYDTPVRYLPIVRDNLEQQNSPSDMLSAHRVLTIDDYHPFLHVATILRAIFAQSGYTLVSDFVESDFFNSLYMSGAYSSTNTSTMNSEMGFFARRKEPVTAQSNFLGKVDANPYAIYHTVGNIVQTANPLTMDSDGELIEGLYNNSGCFEIDDKMILYRPLKEVSVGFEYYLKYTTDHKILTRTRLQGFDHIYLGLEPRITFEIANRYDDRRDEISPNYSYLLVVFEHEEGSEYKFSCDSGEGYSYEIAQFNTRSTYISTPNRYVAEPTLWIKLSSGAWSIYSGDWALYDGYLEEYGSTVVELRVRSSSQIVTPTSPKEFLDIHFKGAEAGMSITLHKECSMQPFFNSSPGHSSFVEFKDVSQHQIRQVELLDALVHMFNLRIYSDKEVKKVYIEPHDEFYNTPVVDWRERTKGCEDMLFEEITPELKKRRRWAYLPPDTIVGDGVEQVDDDFGSWSVTLDSYAVISGEDNQINPLFSSTTNTKGDYMNAQSASLINVGDQTKVDYDGSNFSPRIVGFLGTRELPEDEMWDHSVGLKRYPFATFHLPQSDTESGFTLCFNDEDGVSGLHRFYDKQIDREQKRQRISMTIPMSVFEFDSLLKMDNEELNIRSRILIETDFGSVCAILEHIGDYDTQSQSAKCTLLRLLND